MFYAYKDDAYLCRIDFILIDVCNGFYWIILMGKFVKSKDKFFNIHRNVDVTILSDEFFSGLPVDNFFYCFLQIFSKILNIVIVFNRKTNNMRNQTNIKSFLYCYVRPKKTHQKLKRAVILW